MKILKPVLKTLLAATVFVAASATIAATAKTPEKTIYGWDCKTRTGEVLVKGIHSIPFKVGEVIKSTSDPVGKGIGIKNAGACSQVKLELVDGRTAICEPFGIPFEHAFIGGWKYHTVDKSKCQP